jgi:hypothetical protein
MAIDFPSTPALNDEYTYLGKTWKWDGEKWILLGGSGGVSTADFNKLVAAAVSGIDAEPAVEPGSNTITVPSAGSATTITNAAVKAPSNAFFTYLGAVMQSVTPSGGFGSVYKQNPATWTTGTNGGISLVNVEFETDAADMEFNLRNESPTYSRFRIWVDDVPINSPTQISNGSTGGWFRVKLATGSSTAKRIRLEGQEVAFAGVTINNLATIWKTSRPLGPKCVAICDSYGSNWDGTDASIWAWNNYIYRAGRYLGWNVYPSHVGGSGFQSTNGGSVVKFADRLTSDVVNLAPDIVVVAGSVNDQGLNMATTQANVNSYFSSLRAALPNAAIYALGGICPNNAYLSNMTTISGYVSTAAAANSATFIDSVGWIAGTGTVASPNLSGNADLYAASDAYHLSQAGSTYVSERLATEIGNGLFARKGKIRAAAKATVQTDAPSAPATGDMWYDSDATPAIGSSVYSAVRATNTGTQAFDNVTAYSLAWPTETYSDNAALHSTTVNNSRFKAPATGRYRITAQVSVARTTANTTSFVVGVDKNGSITYDYNNGYIATVDGEVILQVSTGAIQLSANDYLSVGVYGTYAYNVNYAKSWVTFERIV